MPFTWSLHLTHLQQLQLESFSARLPFIGTYTCELSSLGHAPYPARISLHSRLALPAICSTDSGILDPFDSDMAAPSSAIPTLRCPGFFCQSMPLQLPCLSWSQWWFLLLAFLSCHNTLFPGLHFPADALSFQNATHWIFFINLLDAGWQLMPG